MRGFCPVDADIESSLFQGAIADAIGTQKSQLVPMIGYCFVLIYALFLAEPFGKKKIHGQEDVESIDQKVTQVEVLGIKVDGRNL